MKSLIAMLLALASAHAAAVGGMADLTVYDRQEGRPPPAKKPAGIAKKSPKDAENGQTAGAKPNP